MNCPLEIKWGHGKETERKELIKKSKKINWKSNGRKLQMRE